MSDYPRKNEQGETVWACCESSIGPTCGHRHKGGLMAVSLTAAEVSLLILALDTATLDTDFYGEYEAEAVALMRRLRPLV